MVNLDMYNIFNADPKTAYNASFAVWQQPLTVLQARFFKISAQFDFYRGLYVVSGFSRTRDQKKPSVSSGLLI